MKRIKLAFTFAAVALLTFACNNASNTNLNTSNASSAPQNASAASGNSNASATPADELASAREIYGARCVKCHGANADGGVVEFDNVKLKVPSLREGRALTHTDQRFTQQINNGGDGMPKFKDKLSPEEINALVRLIRQDFQGQSATKTEKPTPPKS